MRKTPQPSRYMTSVDDHHVFLLMKTTKGHRSWAGRRPEPYGLPIGLGIYCSDLKLPVAQVERMITLQCERHYISQMAWHNRQSCGCVRVSIYRVLYRVRAAVANTVEYIGCSMHAAMLANSRFLGRHLLCRTFDDTCATCAPC